MLLVPEPAATQVYGLAGSVGMVTIMFQLHTSPPQVRPLPGQSVSLKQPSVASALDAENKATEPTKVA
jgi:hypothetical protein